MRLSLLKLTGVLMLSGMVSGCLESATEKASLGTQEDYAQAQSVFYSTSLQNYALQSQVALTQSAMWQDKTFNKAGLVSLVDEGIDVGNSENVVDSGYCLDDWADPKNVTLITWFSTIDTDGNFRTPAAGGVTPQAIFNELTKNVPPSSLGTYSAENEVKFVSGTAYEPLMANCADLDGVIPDGAPVIVANLNVPQNSDSNTMNLEYRTMPCANNQVGHKIEAARVWSLPNGEFRAGGEIFDAGESIPEAAWEAHSDYCQDAISTVSFEGVAMTSTGVDVAAVMSGNGSSTHRTLGNKLQDVDCRGASSRENEEQDVPAGQYARYDEHTGSNARGHSDAGDHERENEMRSFDTCSQEVAIPDVNAVDVEYDRQSGTERSNQPCGGTDGSYADTYSGYAATVTHPEWTGNVEYEREFHEYLLTHVSSTTRTDGDRRQRGPWYGVSLQCSRNEVLNIGCDSVRPNLSNQYALDDRRGYNYTRNNVITGWADTVSLTPNDPTNPNWNFQAGNSGCIWVDTKTVDEGCPSGQTGTKNHNEERRYALPTLTSSGSWSAWVNVGGGVDTCQEEDRGGPCDCDNDGVDERSDADDNDRSVQ